METLVNDLIGDVWRQRAEVQSVYRYKIAVKLRGEKEHGGQRV